MLDQKVKAVRALERGLDVLLEVNRRRVVSLHELHCALGLPKATLLRMLVTLASRGLIWQRLADGAYLPAAEGVPHRRLDSPDRIAEIASPHLATLSAIAAWPSIIAVPRLDHVEIVETNSPLLRLEAAALGPVGTKLSYIHTATGRAYLAACPPEAREAIIARLRPADARPDDEALIREIIADTAKRGYSLRDPHHPWPDRSKLAVLTDGRRSMGMAVKAHGQAVAAINITWLAQRLSTEDAVARHFGVLQATARAIGAALEREAP